MQVICREERVQTLLHIRRLGRSLSEAIEDLGQYLTQNLCGTLANISGTVPGAAVIAAEVDASGKACSLHESAQLVVVPTLSRSLFGDKCGGVLTLGLSFLPGQHFLGSVELDGLAINGIAEGDCPEDLFSLLLASYSKLGHKPLVLSSVLCKVDVKIHVALNEGPTMNHQAGFERLGVEQCV